MDGWMDRWMNGWIDGQMDRHTDTQTGSNFTGCPMVKLCPFTIKSASLIPAQGTKILHAAWPKRQINRYGGDRKRQKQMDR